MHFDQNKDWFKSTPHMSKHDDEISCLSLAMLFRTKVIKMLANGHAVTVELPLYLILHFRPLFF